AIVDGKAVIELEFLDLSGLDRASAARLGRELADLHRHVGDRFGFDTDNFIGDSPQQNGWEREWPRFFAERRLKPQLARARERGMERRLAEAGESLAERLSAFFLDYHPLPSLLHGDLWGGNVSALPDGTPVIFDPAVYHGDREADIAMSELFGGFPESFYAAYRAAWPLDAGFEVRKTLYNLYHVLNHYNLFGAGYLGQARRMIEKLSAELRG
ncbi:MAG TPA: fructosamine kinase family protein, partial [Rhodocyclaceae bacterium]|nr:fructosamine kinase family protein [Rhodocyclaceae bacterium]